jgi:hypothetical protein
MHKIGSIGLWGHKPRQESVGFLQIVAEKIFCELNAENPEEKGLYWNQGKRFSMDTHKFEVLVCGDTNQGRGSWGRKAGGQKDSARDGGIVGARNGKWDGLATADSPVPLRFRVAGCKKNKKPASRTSQRFS